MGSADEAPQTAGGGTQLIQLPEQSTKQYVTMYQGSQSMFVMCIAENWTWCNLQEFSQNRAENSFLLHASAASTTITNAGPIHSNIINLSS